jgi:sortase A
MGYLSIPKINLKLSIMHGTFDEYIQTAVGHMNGTALPIGGEGTHSVIVGHRGLPSAELFTNIDQLEIGDKFYIHVLDEVLAYEVDNIYPMIEADDIDSLSNAMQVVEGKDYVTLFTCTPYGVNTHRLLVRGVRVEYLGEDEPPTGTEAVVEAAKNYYLIFGIAGLLLAIILILIIRAIFKRKGKQSEGGSQ